MFYLDNASRLALLTGVWDLLHDAIHLQGCSDLAGPLQRVKSNADRLTSAVPAKEEARKRLSRLVQEAEEMEASLDQEITDLSLNLQCFGRMGDKSTAYAIETLFPKGVRAVIRPTGSAQLAVYKCFAEQLGRIQIPLLVLEQAQKIQSGIRSFDEVLQAKKTQKHLLKEAGQEVITAEAELRAALKDLERYAGFFLKAEEIKQWTAPLKRRVKKPKAASASEAVENGK